MTQKDTSVWCFSSSSDERIKIKILGEESAHFFLAMLGPDEQATWFIQKDDSLPEFIAHTTLFNSTPKEKISIKDSISIIREEKREAERRMHFRLNCKVDVTFSKKDLEFKTQSVNLSAGGIQLEQALPEAFLFSFCTVTLTSKDKSLHLNFEIRALNANSDPTRVIFHGISFAAGKQLINWIDNSKIKVAA